MNRFNFMSMSGTWAFMSVILVFSQEFNKSIVTEKKNELYYPFLPFR